MKKMIMTAVLVLAFGSPALADQTQCDGSTAEMLECISKKISVQKSKIQQETYKILAALEKNKEYEPEAAETYEEAKGLIVKANAMSEDAASLQCRVEGILETATGSLGSLVNASCVLTMTKARAELLTKLNKSLQ